MQEAGLQIAASGREMSDAIAALDPQVAALAAARNDPDIAAPPQSPKQLAVIQIVLQICVSVGDPKFHTNV